MAVTAEQLYQRGRHLATRGRYLEARRALADGAARAEAEGDLELSARIAGTTAYVLARLGDVDAGEKICLDAIERPGLSAAGVAQLHGQLGMLALERGLLADAVAWFGKSIRGLEEQPVRQANTRVNRSLASMQRGDLESAIDDLEAAEAVYRAEGLVQEANLAVHNRGYALMLKGDVVAALETMQSVRDPLDTESALWAAINEIDRAEVLREAGLVTEAERSLATVAAALSRRHAPRERATAEYQLARSLLHHEPLAAASVAAAAARRFRLIGSPGWAARAEAVRLRGRLATDGLDRTGEPLPAPARRPTPAVVARAAADLTRLGFHAEADALRLAEVLSHVRRDPRPSAPSTRVTAGTRLESGLLAYEIRAVAAARAGRDAKARRHASAGLDLLDASIAGGASLDLQGSSAMRGMGLLATGLASALRGRRPDVVFEWAERARLGSERIVPVRPPVDPGHAADLAELRVIRMEAGDDWLDHPRARVLRDRARTRQWSSTGVAMLQQRAGLDDVADALGQDDALVSYVFDGRRLAALVATRDSARVVDLDWAGCRAAMRGIRADLDVSAAVTSGAMAEIVRASLGDRLAALSRVLVAPLREGESATRIVVTVPGALSGVPWTMLPDLHGVAISVAGSATGWLRRRSRASRRPDAVGFAVGPRVARGDEEASLAAAAWDHPTRLIGGEASVARVTATAAAVDLLHIAAHGRHAVDNPMFSGLELADGALFGYDVDLIQRVPDTVILSACEVGRSSVRWGEESVGMTRVWLHAGTRCVIAAPVVVADDDACELLGAMHEGLARGVAPAVALAQASVRTGIVAPFQAHGAGF